MSVSVRLAGNRGGIMRKTARISKYDIDELASRLAGVARSERDEVVLSVLIHLATQAAERRDSAEASETSEASGAPEAVQASEASETSQAPEAGAAVAQSEVAVRFKNVFSAYTGGQGDGIRVGDYDVILPRDGAPPICGDIRDQGP
jgi:hypothetical protein